MDEASLEVVAMQLHRDLFDKFNAGQGRNIPLSWARSTTNCRNAFRDEARRIIQEKPGRTDMTPPMLEFIDPETREYVR